MKIHKSHTKSIILTVLIGATAVIAITPALSYWLITNQHVYSATETLGEDSYDIDFSTADSSSDYHTVSVYRAFAEPSDVVPNTNSVTLDNTAASWNAFIEIVNKYEFTGLTPATDSVSSGSYPHYTTITYPAGTYASSEKYEDVDHTPYCVLTIADGGVVNDYRKASFMSSWTYTYSGTYSTTTASLAVGDPKIDSEDTNGGYYGQFQVRSGEIITSKMFATFFSSMEEDYYFSSFIYTDLSEKTPFYLNQTQVISDLNLYVVFYKQEPITLGLSSLTDEINNNTDTLKVSNGGTTSYDLNSDIGYDSETKTVNVGYFDRDTVLASGTTVNLCLADGNVMDIVEYQSSSNNRSQYINENHSDKTCDYTVKLAGDLEIYGQLTVGAEIGSATNQGVQSNIHTNYVKLDLCGHTINIHNGGSLIGYGVITDSVGNGEIHVYGGAYIESTIVIYDYKGGSSTVGAFAVDVSPFSNYNLPYLQVPTYLEYDNNGWGMLKAYYCINPFSSVVTEIHNDLNLIGTGNDCLFVLDSGTPNSSFVLLSLTENPNVSSNNSSTYTASQALERHFNIYFNNVNVTLEYFTLDFNISGIVDISMKTNQFDFPISSFFSMYMYNSNFTVSSRIVFQKGSSLYMDEDSDLIFSYQTIDRTYVNSLAAHEESVTIAGSIFFMDVHVDSYVNNSGTESMYTSDRHNYQNLSTVETYLNSNLAFWKYSVSAYRIAGTIYFTHGNAESYPYSIAGYCDVGSVGTISESGTIGNTYNFHTTDSNSYNPFNNLILDISTNSRNVYFKTYDFDGINGTYDCETLAYSADNTCEFNALVRGRALPLISNGVAYSYSNVFNEEGNDRYSPNIVGTYNQDLNLIDSNGQFYYYNSSDVDDKPYTGTGNTSSKGILNSNPNERNREYNHTTRLKACSYDGNNHYITDSDTNNDGGTYVFFSSCYLPYSKGNVNLQRLLASTNISSVSSLDLGVTYSDTYSRWIISS